MTSVDIVGFYEDYTVGNLATYPVGYKILFIDRDEIWEKIIDTPFADYLTQWVFKRAFVTKQPRSMRTFHSDSKSEQTSGFMDGQIDIGYPTTISKVRLSTSTPLFGKVAIYKNGTSVRELTPSVKDQTFDLAGNLINLVEGDVVRVLLKSYLISNFPNPIYDKTVFLYNFDNDIDTKIITNKAQNMVSNYGYISGSVTRNIISGNQFTYTLNNSSVNFYQSKDTVVSQTVVIIEVSRLTTGIIFQKSPFTLSIVAGLGLSLNIFGIILSLVNLLLFSGNLVFTIVFNQGSTTISVNGTQIYSSTSIPNPFINNESPIAIGTMTGTLYDFNIRDIDNTTTYLRLTDADVTNSICVSTDDTQVSAYIDSADGSSFVTMDKFKFGGSCFSRTVSNSDKMIIPYHPNLSINDVAILSFFIFPTVVPANNTNIIERGTMTKAGDFVLKSSMTLQYRGNNSNTATISLSRDVVANKWQQIVIKFKPSSVEVYHNSILIGQQTSLNSDFSGLWSTNYSPILVGTAIRAYFDEIVLIRDDLNISQYVSRTATVSVTVD